MTKLGAIVCVSYCIIMWLHHLVNGSPEPDVPQPLTSPQPPTSPLPPTSSAPPRPPTTTLPPPPRWACDRLMEPTPWDSPTLWWESERGLFVQMREVVEDSGSAASNTSEFATVPPEKLRLRAVALLYPVAQRIVTQRTCTAPSPQPLTTASPREDYDDGWDPAAEADEEVVQLCVALVDATAYTSQGAEENVAWATLHTDPLAPVAVLEVDSGCYARHRSASRCRPCMLAPTSFRNLPLWNFSPLREGFWKALDVALLPLSNTSSGPTIIWPEPWLRRINTASSKNRSMESRWLLLPRLPELRSLELTGNAWTASPPPPLPGMARLTELRLHGNEISQLPDDFFSQTPRLEHVILARNMLTQLPKSIAGLKMLRLLDVTNPIRKGQSFLIDYISELPNLQILGLENQAINGDVIPILSMPSLTFLNMSGCGLTTVGNNSIADSKTTDLQVLDLSNNHLQTVPNTLLSKYPKLSNLLLNRNELRVLGHTLNTPKLVYLDVSQNHLKTLPTFPTNSQIKILKARDNVLENFSEKFWEPCSFLEILDLSHNHLQSFPKLLNQEKLQTLDVSENEIQTLLGTDFGKMKDLKSIDISNNLLSVLDPNIFTNLVGIKVANFSYNKLLSVTLISNSLEILDLNFNVLISLPVLNTTSVSHIMLSNNLITIANFSSINATNLQEINLSRNKISLAYLHNITIGNVDLSHNKLLYPPFDASYVKSMNLVDNPLNGDDHKDEVDNSWESWLVGVLVVILFLGMFAFLLILGGGIRLRRLSQTHEPISTFRSSSLQYT